MITLGVTYQQTKGVVDPVNGTYQTVLTIDPSVRWSDIVGTYNCTVENDRGESSETVVVPGEMCTFLLFIYHCFRCTYTFILHVNVIARSVMLRGVKDWVHMKTAKMMQDFNWLCNLDVNHKLFLIFIIKVVYLCTLHNKIISPAHLVYVLWRPTPTWFSNLNT